MYVTLYSTLTTTLGYSYPASSQSSPTTTSFYLTISPTYSYPTPRPTASPLSLSFTPRPLQSPPSQSLKSGHILPSLHLALYLLLVQFTLYLHITSPAQSFPTPISAPVRSYSTTVFFHCCQGILC